MESSIPAHVLLSFYKQKFVQEAIVANAIDKEVAIKYGEAGFGKRPDLLKYPNDVLSLVQEGATSFHISEEHWSNVLQVHPELNRAELDKLRSGWDLILDIDSEFFEYSQIAADLIVKALQDHGITAITAKFSGNKGFHIAVPYEAFPKQVHNQNLKNLFPEGPRRIAFYLRDIIKQHLASRILEKEDINVIMKKAGKSFTELLEDKRFNPFALVGIDTILLSSRHLYRSVYSFNEKSGLVSVPVALDTILAFSKDQAKPENIKPVCRFLDSNVVPGEARQLVIQAFDYTPKEEKPREDEIKAFIAPEQAVPEQFFPPCIKLILAGMEDGKKRSLFILTNFLTSLGWDYDQIEALLHEWNKKNKQPLKEVLIKGHLRYHKQHRKRILPPNCQNVQYYTDLRVCMPDNLCRMIKNPVHYALRKTKYMREEPKQKSARARKGGVHGTKDTADSSHQKE